MSDEFDPNKVPATAAAFGIDGRVSVSGWSFNVDARPKAPVGVGSLPAAQTIMIVKSQDRSIQDLVADTDSWTTAGLMSPQRVAELKKLIEDYIKDARQEHATDTVTNPSKPPKFGTFLDALEDPNWNGFLFLDVAIDLSNLPLQIKGLLGGINQKDFKVHHLGVPTSRLTLSETGLPEVKRSSIFGLINYPSVNNSPPPIDKKPGSELDKKFDFKVLKLAVLFKNSAIARFDCQIKTYVGSLFTDNAYLRRQGSSQEEDVELVFSGQYESRVVDGEKVETYTFIHEETYFILVFKKLFKELKLTKLQFTTERSTPLSDGREGETVSTRLSFWGKASFQNLKDLVGLPIGLEQLDFDDLGITFDFDLIKGKIELPDLRGLFAPAALKFKLQDSPGEGFFSRLPFRFSYFQFASFGNELNLAEEGFFALSANGSLPQFRYGLAFDVDLGALGALTSKLKGMSLTVLFGWMPNSQAGGSDPNLAIGFRFEGGGGKSLDIGLQGILRLTAKEYELGRVDDTFMIALKKAHLYILGEAIPAKDNPGFTFYLFADPANLKAEKLGWFISIEDQTISDGLHLDYMALGQRVKAYQPAGAPTTKEVVQWMQKNIGAIQGDQNPDEPNFRAANDLVVNNPITYDANRDWTVALRTRIFELFDLDIVFMDPDMYGARLRVPGSQSSGALLFDLDILYRKLSDDLGVYSTELILPDSLRQLEFGAASVTVPVIGVEIYTDGGFTLDLGYPGEELDFARSFTVQVLPLIGSGGLLYSQVPSAGIPKVPQPIDKHYSYDPILRVAFAARVGLGKEIRKGILRAGASITVFGMIDGIWGELKTTGHPRNTHLPKPPNNYLIVAGRFGILGEIFGYVDFGIVKAGVSIRVWASNGIIFETWQPTILFFEAGVSVRVTIVIARIKVFGKRIEIKASFSFGTTIRYDWKVGRVDSRYKKVFIGSSESTAIADSREEYPDTEVAILTAEPINWDGSILVWSAKKPLKVWYTPEVSLTDDLPGLEGEARPQIVHLFMVEGGPEANVPNNGVRPPFENLVKAILAWAVHQRWKDKFSGKVLDWALTLDQIEGLAASVQDAVSLSDPVPNNPQIKPLEYAEISKFLGNHFNVEFIEPAKSGDSKGGALFPAPSEISVTYGSEPPIVFKDLRSVPKAYRDEFDKLLEDALVQIDSRIDDEEGGPESTFEKNVVEMLFEDYFALLIKGGVQALKQAHIDKSGQAGPGQKIKLSGLFKQMQAPVEESERREQNAFSQLAATAGRYVLHGMRVPKPDNVPALDSRHSIPLFELAELQSALPDDPTDFQVSFNTVDNEAWFSSREHTRSIEEATYKLLLSTQIKPELVRANSMPALRRQNRRYGLGNPVVVNSSVNTTDPFAVIWSHAPGLITDLSTGNDQGVPLRLFFNDPESEEPDEIVGPFAQALSVPVEVAPVEEAATSSNGYALQLRGATEVNRVQIGRLLKETQNSDVLNPGDIKVHLVFETEGSAHKLDLNLERSFVFRTNLSETARPPESFESVAADADFPYAAKFSDDDRMKFLRLIWLASVVNSGGFFLNLKASNSESDSLLRAISEQKSWSKLQLVFELVAFPGTGQNSDFNVVQSLSNGLILKPGGQNDPVIEHVRNRDPRSSKNVYAASPDKIYESVRPPGTIGVSFLRSAPSKRHEATEVDQIAKELDARFNLLEWEVQGSSHFASFKSDFVLPIGPVDPEQEDVADIAGFDLDDWLYEQSVPAHHFAKKNHALIKTARANGEDRPVLDPYAGVGESITLKIGFRDIFGNRLPDVRETQSYRLEYTDILINPATIPGVKSGFDFGSVNSGKIIVDFRFEPNDFMIVERQPDNTPVLVPYDPDQADPNSQQFDPAHGNLREKIAAALARFDEASRQLADAELKMSLMVSFFRAKEVDFTAERHKVQDFCVECGDYLETMLVTPASQQGNIKVPDSLELSAQNISLSRDPFVEFKTSLILRRDHSKAAKGENGEPVRQLFEAPSEVLPPASVTEGEGLQLFAKRFEAAFDGWLLATGTGAKNARSLWAVDEKVVRFSVDWGVLDRELSPDPYTFAPKPISTSLMSADLEYIDPFEGRKTHGAVREKDVDSLSRVFLSDVEKVLSPEYSVNVRRRLGNISGQNDAIDRLLNVKNDIAQSLSHLITPVLKDYVHLSSVNENAVRAIYVDRLKEDLRSTNNTAALLAYPLQRLGIAFAPGAAPSLYGSVELPQEGFGSEAPLSFRPVKLTLDTPKPTLALMIESGSPRLNSFYDLDLTLNITHIEHPLKLGGMRDKAWLKLVRSAKVNLHSDSPRYVRVPFAIRRYPLPPSIISQKGVATPIGAFNSFKDWAVNARDWSFSFEYSTENVDQDIIYATASYNTVDKIFGVSTEASESEDWSARVFKALAIYHEWRGKIWKALKTLPGAAPVGESELAAAIDAFAVLAESVRDALEPSIDVEAAMLQQMEDRLRINEVWNDHQDKLIIEVTRLGNPVAKKVVVQPVSHIGEVVSPLSAAVGDQTSFSWVFDQNDLPSRRPADDGPQSNWIYRRVTLTGLDVLVAQSAVSSVQLKRNEELISSRVTDDRFIYATDVNRAGEPINPTIMRKDVVSVTDNLGRVPKDHLESMLEHALDLSATNASSRPNLRMEIDWGFENERFENAIPELKGLHRDRAPAPQNRLVALELNPVGSATTANGDTKKSVAKMLVQSILHIADRSLAPTDPTSGESIGSSRIGLRVFASHGDDNKVVLELTNLKLPLKDLS